mmetsp:Transcript_32168/g.78158  ORF Transcript_32168/g.78158 Transcript_32168/m.78158 type:complete len:267 (-) Transcript_32168:418-1218(-)
MLQRMKHGTDKHGLPISSRKQVFVLCKFRQKDCPNIDDKVNKLRVLDEFPDLRVLPDVVFDSMINALHKRLVFARPAFRNHTLISPNLHESIEARISKEIVHDCHNAIPAKEWIDIFECFVQVETPVGCRMELHMLCRNGIEPEQNRCLRRIQNEIIKLCIDKLLCIQINLDRKQISDLVLAILIHIGKIGKVETCDIASIATGLCSSIIMDGLGLLQKKCRTHSLIIARNGINITVSCQVVSKPQNDGSLLPKKVRTRADECICP